MSTQASDPVLHDGYMSKQGGGSNMLTRRWKKRWFVLFKDRVEYYRSAQQADEGPDKLRGVIYLKKIVLIDGRGDAKKKHALYIQTASDRSPYFVTADSDKQKFAWVEKIRAAAEDLGHKFRVQLPKDVTDSVVREVAKTVRRGSLVAREEEDVALTGAGDAGPSFSYLRRGSKDPTHFQALSEEPLSRTNSIEGVSAGVAESSISEGMARPRGETVDSLSQSSPLTESKLLASRDMLSSSAPNLTGGPHARPSTTPVVLSESNPPQKSVNKTAGRQSSVSFGATTVTSFSNSTPMPRVEDSAKELVQEFVDAARVGDVGRMKAIIESGRVHVDSRDHNGLTALHWAISSHQNDVAWELLGFSGPFSSDPDVRSSEGQYTALHFAAWKKNLKGMKKLLLRKATIDAVDRNGMVPLHWACYTGFFEGVQELVRYGANANVISTIEKWSPLHYLARNENKISSFREIAQYLMAKGTDKNLRDVNGETAGALASRKGFRALAALLNKESGSHGNDTLEEDIPTIHISEIDIDPSWKRGGGFKVVRKGVWKGKPVCILELKPNLGKRAEDEFRKEMCMLHGMDHPNIMRVYGVLKYLEDVESKPTVAFVAEFVEFSLLEFLHSSRVEMGSPPKVLPRHLRMELLHRITEGVIYLHENEISHRDLKSGNILVSEDLTSIKVADLGLAKQTRGQGTSNTFEIGCDMWRSPEMLKGVPYNTDLSDVYQLALIFYEVLTGLLPFEDALVGNGAQQSISPQERICVRKERPMLQPGAEVPYKLWELVDSMWSDDPESRPELETEVLTALKSESMIEWVDYKEQPRGASRDRAHSRLG